MKQNLTQHSNFCHTASIMNRSTYLGFLRDKLPANNQYLILLDKTQQEIIGLLSYIITASVKRLYILQAKMSQRNWNMFVL